MRTKEFIKKVKALGYEAHTEGGTTFVTFEGYIVVDFGQSEEWIIDPEYPHFEKLSWEQKKELMRIVCEYMLTDPAEREEEKRYLLRLDVPMLDNPLYLHYGEYSNVYTVAFFSVVGSNGFKTIFTESEISQMDITGFEKEEVE